MTCFECLSVYGGVRQYLNAMMPTLAAKIAFEKWLQHQFPASPGPSVQYVVTHADIPKCLKGSEDAQSAFYFHISAFSFDETASMKPAPYLEVTDGLIGNIITDGFVTSSEAVFVKPTSEACSNVFTLMCFRLVINVMNHF